MNEAATFKAKQDEERKRVRELAAEYAERGDPTGWFEQLYREGAAGKTEIPWADMQANRFFTAWAEQRGLRGDGRKALVVGCGLGDDAIFLEQLGFEVTAFDISTTAIEWAKRLHPETSVSFEQGDLLEPYSGWLGAFEFVLEIYTIQPLPIELRPTVIDRVASLVAPGGELVVVARGRGDDEEPDQLPWPLSRRDLGRFIDNGLDEVSFEEVAPDEEGDTPRFIVEYTRPGLSAL
jgi:2-polyprenyl-3-methyl-5-hydroxy-6-metoxy-1,4-benzoquinol methylase